MPRGRVLGSKNKKARALTALLDDLARAKRIDWSRLVENLYALATESPEPMVRIAATRELLNRRYGLARAEISMTHEAGESFLSILDRINRDPARIAQREALERWRASRALPAAAVQEKPCPRD